ncbi:MAG: hypothetical protein WCU00_09910 [Candidatus Latescibacterota bacterium]
MSRISRRSVLKTFAVLSGGMAVTPSILNHSVKASAASIQNTTFWDEYYQGALSILTGLRDTQVEPIEREMQTAYTRIKKGGSVYSQITAGHFPTEETALDRTGQPGVFKFIKREAKEEEYARLNPNDVIITNTINTGNIGAMKRGIRVIGVTVNYYPFAKTPPEEGYQIEYGGKILHIEDASSVVIDSQLPWNNGLVHPADHPDFPVMPGGGIAQAAVYWMAAAELAGLEANKGAKSSGWARSYIQTCIDRVQMVGKDRPKFMEAGRLLADLVAKGAKWWIAGHKALVSDACGVANGPRITRSLDMGKLNKGDIVLIGSYSSNNPEEIALARDCRAKGAYVATFGPYSLENDASGPRLYKEADLAFNTYSPESWGIVPVKGLDRKICPATGVIGDLVLWLTLSQWADVMSQMGKSPYYWKGFFMKNGTEYNKQMQPLFEARGW